MTKDYRRCFSLLDYFILNLDQIFDFISILKQAFLLLI